MDRSESMKSLLLIFTFTLFVTSSQSQEITRNNVYLEIGGASFFYSVNYEKLLSKNVEKNLSVRLGFMYINTFNEQERKMRSIPISVSYLKKLKKNYFEVGLSSSVIYDTYPLFNQFGEKSSYVKDWIFMPSIRAGIRHQPSAKGFFWNTLFQYSLVTIYDPGSDFPPEVYSTPFLSIGLGQSF